MAAFTIIRGLLPALLLAALCARAEQPAAEGARQAFSQLAPSVADSAHDWIAWAPSLAEAARAAATDGRPVLLVVRPSQPDLGPCCAAAELHRLPELASLPLIRAINTRFIPALAVAADLEAAPGGAEREQFLAWKAARPNPPPPLDRLQLWVIANSGKVAVAESVEPGGTASLPALLAAAGTAPATPIPPRYPARLLPDPPAMAASELPVALALRRLDAQGHPLPGQLKWIPLSKEAGGQLLPPPTRRNRKPGATWVVGGAPLTSFFTRLYPEWDGPHATNWIGSSLVTATLVEHRGGEHVVELGGDLTLRHAFYGLEDQPPAVVAWRAHAKILENGELREFAFWTLAAKTMGGPFAAAAMSRPERVGVGR